MTTKRLIDNREAIEEAYEKDENLKPEEVEELKRWLVEKFGFKFVSELFVMLCHHSCYYKIDDTKKCLENYFYYKSKYPRLMKFRNPNSSDLEQSLKTIFQMILPRRTPDDCDVLYIRLTDPDPSNYSFERQLVLTNMICSLQIYQRGLGAGLIFLQDCTNSGLGHALKVNLFDAKAMIGYVQEALPVRLKALHMINMTYISERIANMTRPLLNQKTRDLVKFHATMDSVYEHVPRDVLPRDLGGTLGTIAELQAEIVDNLKRNADFFEEDDAVIDDLRRCFNLK